MKPIEIDKIEPLELEEEVVSGLANNYAQSLPQINYDSYRRDLLSGMLNLTTLGKTALDVRSLGNILADMTPESRWMYGDCMANVVPMYESLGRAIVNEQAIMALSSLIASEIHVSTLDGNLIISKTTSGISVYDVENKSEFTLDDDPVIIGITNDIFARDILLDKIRKVVDTGGEDMFDQLDKLLTLNN